MRRGSAWRMDQLFARVNSGEHVEIPTAIGFCVYIGGPA